MSYKYEDLRRSTNNIFNKSLIIGAYDELIIYVEDEDLKHIYDLLLNRIIGEDIKFENIYLSGGKKKVEELYRMYKEYPKVPSIFIVDLDFDSILEKEFIQDNNFIYLDRYSIENYLLCDQVGINLLNARTGIGKVESFYKINFDDWLENLENEFLYLNSVFLSIQKLELGVKNTSKKAEEFLKNNSGEIDNEKVTKYIESVMEKAVELNKFEELHTLIDKFNYQQKVQYDNIWHIFPGKIILKMFYKYLMGMFPNGLKQLYYNDFFYAAASECNTEPLKYIEIKTKEYMSLYNEKKLV